MVPTRCYTSILLALSALIFTGGHVSAAPPSSGPLPQIVSIAPGSAYRQTNFVSDIPGLAPILDPLLVNPWGISMTATSPFWVSNNGTSSSTLYRGDVGGVPLIKQTSMPSITIPGGLPTGTVANGTTDFVIASGSGSGAARFLFASITGNITGWNPNVPAAGSTTAVIAASQPGHVYTGLALANNGANFLYAADFANGTIDVFNSTFALQPAASFPFADPTIPTTAGNTFHPYNIQNIGGALYVTYAKVGSDGRAEAGVGNGFVRRFNANGVRDLTFGINNGALNSPWGVTIAPATFGIFGGALLIGNFGEGNPSIHAFNPTTGAFLGTIQDESGNGIEIDELWALTFGNGGNGGDPNALYFTAGTAEEEHGLFGSLRPTTASATSLIQFSASEFQIGEGAGSIKVTVTRAGDVSGAASVNFNTFDSSETGRASQKSDYEIALGKLTFEPGETSKTFTVLLVNDHFVEGTEEIGLYISNPTGAGVGLGSPNEATIQVLDNDLAGPTTEPIDNAQFFVRQLFLDLLNRDGVGSDAFDFLVGRITACGTDQACIDQRRVDVATAFFKSVEFGEAGTLAYLTNHAAFHDAPLYGVFMRDTHLISDGVVVGEGDWEEQLEANKVSYFSDFIARPQFVGNFPNTQTPAQFVDALIANAGFTPSAAERQAAIDEFGGAPNTTDQAARARALRRIAENATFRAADFIDTFIHMEYFALLRRDPDTAGYNLARAKLAAAGGDIDAAGTVDDFLKTDEYRQRFGPGTLPSDAVAAPPTTTGKLANISSRARVETGDNVMIGGFIVTGTDPKQVLVRGLGPSLTSAGIFDVLANSSLSLRAADGSVLASNNNWRDSQESEIEATGLAPANDLESAILATLSPGAYTAIESGVGGSSGVGLVEVYDQNSGANSQLANISTRAIVRTDNNVLIGGFIVKDNPATVLIRGLGASLSAAGITNPLLDATVELHNASGATVFSNDNWRDPQQLEILSLRLAPANESEAGILATLPAGGYTAIVRGKDATSGVGLVEIYNIP